VDIIFLTALLCLLCPALVVVLGEAIGILHPRIRRGYYFIVVTILAACFALPIFKRLLGTSGWGILAAASVFALFFALLYVRFRPFRANLAFLSPVILVFPILFLSNPGIHEVIFPGKSASAANVTVKDPAPVFVVVFDEFPVTSLMNEKRVIDPVRYPNFAALAEDAYWFRNATSISSNTLLSIPSTLTGRYPKPEDYFPTSSHHPNQLFTLLGGSYEIKSFEILTELCPEELCGEKIEQPALSERIRSLLSDLSIIYFHFLLPPEFSRRLPNITDSWKDFGKEAPELSGPALESMDKGSGWNSLWARIDWNDRTQIFERFVDSIEPDDHQTLFFIHVLFPHSGWSYLPSGQRHTLSKGGEIRGAVGANNKGLPEDLWRDDPWAITQMLQRHLIQVGLADKLLGDLIARLKSLGLYDQSLIAITSDHGVSFQSGKTRRDATKKNYYDIMAIPLLIKAPHQKQGVLNDRNVEAIDVLPTIADMLGIDLPWSVDGQSAIALNQPERKNKAIYDNAAARHVFEPIMDAKYQTLDRIIDLFGSESRDTLYRIGTYNSLIGKKVGEKEIKQQTGFEVFLEYQVHYSRLKMDAKFIPANILGQVFTDRQVNRPFNLAVAVNGTIRAVTETYMQNGEIKFSALVPEESFREGANEIGIYFARGSSLSDLSSAKIRAE